MRIVSVLLLSGVCRGSAALIPAPRAHINYDISRRPIRTHPAAQPTTMAIFPRSPLDPAPPSPPLPSSAATSASPVQVPSPADPNSDIPLSPDAVGEPFNQDELSYPFESYTPSEPIPDPASNWPEAQLGPESQVGNEPNDLSNYQWEVVTALPTLPALPRATNTVPNGANAIGPERRPKMIPAEPAPAAAVAASPTPDARSMEIVGPTAAHPDDAYITAVPMAMVHSEYGSQTGSHIMQPGDSLLVATASPAAMPISLAMGGANPNPRLATKAAPTPVIQGATFAAGGKTYTASVDKDLNILLDSSTLKPGGPGATLGSGAAIVSVVPGGALVVDGGTLTMSAIRPVLTGAVLTLHGAVVTATQRGSGAGELGQVLVVGAATLSSGGPAATVFGEHVSYARDGVLVGGKHGTPGTAVPISTITEELVYQNGPVAKYSASITSMRASVTSSLARSGVAQVGGAGPRMEGFLGTWMLGMVLLGWIFRLWT
ncbi:hypothetical protein EJ06DRAFT_583603 [Trichodelitschia bisporula]|uniref:Uncharacterized protein n=1 Tax=Trichodelitschia bisporula TaxID=703511 RepID=A0A6G1HRE5_9PEZI|nr:hypothetical protein EJ06DRAFT_583603 [Trichodelitschia bisporula]